MYTSDWSGSCSEEGPLFGNAPLRLLYVTAYAPCTCYRTPLDISKRPCHRPDTPLIDQALSLGYIDSYAYLRDFELILERRPTAARRVTPSALRAPLGARLALGMCSGQMHRDPPCPFLSQDSPLSCAKGPGVSPMPESSRLRLRARSTPT